jgi:short-subunit dehydrogenase
MREQKVALITGASSGIGRSTALLLVERGFRVFGTSRKPRQSKHDSIEMVQLEVCSDTSVTECMLTVVQQVGRIDILINNIGDGIAGAAEETNLDEAKSVFEANFFGTVRMVNAILPIMRQQKGGQIINLSSIGGLIGIPFRSFYSASKFALEGYTEALRHEVKRFNIRVSIVEPGFVKTEAADRVPNALNSLEVYTSLRQRLASEFSQSMRNGMPPIMVATNILRIIESERPRFRYTVGAQATIVSVARRIIPESVFEWIMARQFKLDR